MKAILFKKINNFEVEHDGKACTEIPNLLVIANDEHEITKFMQGNPNEYNYDTVIKVDEIIKL